MFELIFYFNRNEMFHLLNCIVEPVRCVNGIYCCWISLLFDVAYLILCVLTIILNFEHWIRLEFFICFRRTLFRWIIFVTEKKVCSEWKKREKKEKRTQKWHANRNSKWLFAEIKMIFVLRTRFDAWKIRNVPSAKCRMLRRLSEH